MKKVTITNDGSSQHVDLTNIEGVISASTQVTIICSDNLTALLLEKAFAILWTGAKVKIEDYVQ